MSLTQSDLKAIETLIKTSEDRVTDQLSGRIDEVEERLTYKINDVEDHLSEKIDAVDLRLGIIERIVITDAKRVDAQIKLLRRCAKR